MNLGQPSPLPIGDEPLEIESFCPACGEPQINGVIRHAPDCPYAGDDRPPEQGHYYDVD